MNGESLIFSILTFIYSHYFFTDRKMSTLELNCCIYTT